MSFWSEFPGPHWWDCIESLNPCSVPKFGIQQETLTFQQRRCSLPAGCRFIKLLPKHAKQIESFLRAHYSIYGRCKISLSESRIQQGFSFDDWIGVGVYTVENTLVGCCMSKPLGSLKLSHEVLQNSGLVDYFCVDEHYRKQGIASAMLEQLVEVTARQKRVVHLFLKEGFPLWKVPPLYSSQFLVRRKKTAGEAKEYIGSMGIALQTPIRSYTHAEYLPLRNFIANLPSQLNGDSELFSFNYKGHSVFLCMTNIHHRTAPEGYRIGELSWMLPQTAEVPLAIQKLAVETCIDISPFDLVLMDKAIPHDSKQGWRNDAGYSWYIFNYNPGSYFTTKPFFIL
jgi:GNAT superfamily N-acetyltransferase